MKINTCCVLAGNFSVEFNTDEFSTLERAQYHYAETIMKKGVIHCVGNGRITMINAAEILTITLTEAK